MAVKNIEPKVRVPGTVKKGEPFEIKCVVTHIMETGQRPNKETGGRFPRDILNKLIVTYGGKTVLHADWHPGVSSNPYTSFFVVATASGPMEFTWTDDKGETHKKSVNVNVAG
ncbi:MAG: thiosulfate oxidation carrier complex protein SoxZ [Rhodospirillaceae bacterium]